MTVKPTEGSSWAEKHSTKTTLSPPCDEIITGRTQLETWTLKLKLVKRLIVE